MARNRSRLLPPVQPPGEQKEGYVLVKAILTRGAPDSVVEGVGRYPRMLYGQHWYVHPEDLARQPQYFEALPEPDEPSTVYLVAPDPTEPPPESGAAPSGFISVSGVNEEEFKKALETRSDKRRKSRRDDLRELLDKHE